VGLALALLLLSTPACGQTSSGDGEQITPTESVDTNCSTPTFCEFMSQYRYHLRRTPLLRIGVNITLGDEVTATRIFHNQMRNRSLRVHPQNTVCGNIPSSEFIKVSSCSWNYICDYNPRRFPPYIFHATCVSPITEVYSCTPVTYPVPVLYTTGCNILTNKTDWVWGQERIAVACARSMSN